MLMEFHQSRVQRALPWGSGSQLQQHLPPWRLQPIGPVAWSSGSEASEPSMRGRLESPTWHGMVALEQFASWLSFIIFPTCCIKLQFAERPDVEKGNLSLIFGGSARPLVPCAVRFSSRGASLWSCNALRNCFSFRGLSYCHTGISMNKSVSLYPP